MNIRETDRLFEVLDSQNEVIGSVTRSADKGKAVYICKSYISPTFVSHEKSMAVAKETLIAMLCADAHVNQHSFCGESLFDACPLCSQGATDAVHNVRRVRESQTVSYSDVQVKSALQQIVKLTADLSDEQLSDTRNLEDGAVHTGLLLLQARDLAKKALGV